MVAFGHDIIESIRRRHAKDAGLTDQSRLGVFGTFYKGAKVLKSAVKGPTEIIGMATTDDLDLDQETVLPSGADWKYFEANGNLFLDHCYSSMQAVARLRSITPVGNGWQVHAAFINNPMNENIRACQTLAEANGLGMSIGFEVQDGGPPTADEVAKYPGTTYVIRRWKGIEVSFTAMPCNVACRTHALVYGDDSEPKAARARELLSKNRVPESVWAGVGLKIKPRRVIVCS